MVTDAKGYDKRCPCPRFRRAQWTTNARGDRVRVVNAAGSAFYAPEYHLRAYGLRNPFVAECIRLGLYVDIEEAPTSPADAGDRTSLRLARKLRLL